MLVLTRKQQQQIQIGDNIKITILRVKGRTIRVGIEAPEGVRILRTELSSTKETSPAPRPLQQKPKCATVKAVEIQEPKFDRIRPVSVTSLRPYLDLIAAEGR